MPLSLFSMFVECMAFKKCQVAGVLYAFGQSAYTYVTGSSYRTVLDRSMMCERTLSHFVFLCNCLPIWQVHNAKCFKICSDFINRVLHSSHWLKTVGECVCVCVCVLLTLLAQSL